MSANHIRRSDRHARCALRTVRGKRLAELRSLYAGWPELREGAAEARDEFGGVRTVKPSLGRGGPPGRDGLGVRPVRLLLRRGDHSFGVEVTGGRKRDMLRCGTTCMKRQQGVHRLTGI
jgi:hypothetical protein